MAVPPKSKQVERVAEFLNDALDSGQDLETLSKRIIDGVYDMWTKDMATPRQIPVVGKAFTWPMLTKVYFVAWIGNTYMSSKHGSGTHEMVWLVAEDSSYGMLIKYDGSIWHIAEESPDRRRKKDGPRPGSPGRSSDGWKPGDRVSVTQRKHTYEILAVGDKANLLREVGSDVLQAESSANLAKYYTRERT